MAREPVYWWSDPPEQCDTCTALIHNIFYDARTRIGPWAIMCPMCFWLGPGTGKVGTGFGQKFEKQIDGKWLKTEG